MSTDLDDICKALSVNAVPALWTNFAYPSLKPLSSWVTDLLERLDFMQKWAVSGHPKAFWLSGFFFPHSFLTATLQTYSRKKTISIDSIRFSFEILGTKEKEELEGAPDEGVFIYGLYI